MGLRLKSNTDNTTTTFKDMQHGQVGIIVDTYNEENYNRIVMKLHSGSVVSLSDGDMWSGIGGLSDSINVRLLPKGTEFIID